ncbi:hypothetical protein ACTXT7_008012 [Hymenolepis weldensis]
MKEILCVFLDTSYFPYPPCLPTLTDIVPVEANCHRVQKVCSSVYQRCSVIPKLLYSTIKSPPRPPTLKVETACDLVFESPDAKPINQPVEHAQQLGTIASNKSDKNMSIIFTCNVCKNRTQKFFSKLAYTKGLVIIRCPSCQSLHLIADNLGWIKEKTPWRIGEQRNLLLPQSIKPEDLENGMTTTKGEEK